MTHEHPASEELLLWQSGELDSHEAEVIQAHVSQCTPCREVLARHTQTYEEVAWVSEKAAHRRMRTAMTARVHRRFSLPSTMTASVAALLIVALILFTMDLTPSARADTLLDKAARQQSEEQPEQVPILLRSGGHACSVNDGRQLVSVGASENPSCQSLTMQLHRIGWTGRDALSADSFRVWRQALSRKKDSIHKTGDTTEIQTETVDSPIHKAMLRLRNSDNHPLAASYEFAADGNEPAAVIEVGEQPAPPTILTAHTPDAPAPSEGEPHPHPLPVAVLNPLDDAESRVRLALHSTGLDSDVLIAVSRAPDAVRVWGVVPTEKALAALTDALQHRPMTQVDVAIEGEQGHAPQSLPWTAWRGDAPPLAAEQLQAHFPDDPHGSQQFLTDVDALTRRLVSETRNRDAMLALAARMVDADSASSLRAAAAQLDTTIHADLVRVAEKLGPFLPSPLSSGHPVTSSQAMQLYTLVHELFFMSRSQDDVDRDSAWARVQSLLAGRAV